MKHIKRGVSAFLLYFLLVYQVFSTVIISEMMPNTIDDTQLEYIEIYNSGSIDINLSGSYLQDLSGKQFLFGSGDVLKNGEARKIYRPESKLLLNNADETIFYYSASGELLGEYSYIGTMKSQPVHFYKISDVVTQIEEETSTGSLNLTGTGVSDSHTGATLGMIPDIILELQSGLSFVTGSLYQCDKTDCKINLSIEQIFTGSYIQDDYFCVWDFGTGALYSTGTQLKCNPGYVDYPQGFFSGSVTLGEKENIDNYKQYVFYISNVGSGGIDIMDTSSGGVATATGIIGENSNSGGMVPILTQSGELLFPSVDELLLTGTLEYVFQQPSYIVNHDKADMYYCDRTREECKINLDFSSSFSGGINPSDYECHISFGTGIITGEENKCNPATVIFPIGVHNVSIQIIEKTTHGIFSSGSFIIQNDGYQVPISSRGSSSSFVSSIVSETPRIHIGEPIIEIQSGLTPEYFCTKNDCSVNLKYQELHEDERCVWSFPGGEFSASTLEKCNPGYIKYSQSGNYEATLKVYQKNLESNYKIKKFYMYNPEILEKSEQEGEKNNPEKHLLDYNVLRISKALPNPNGVDNNEYIELENTSGESISLYGCFIDDILDGGSKKYTFPGDLILGGKKKKKIYKYESKINLNNDNDSIYLFCFDNEIDTLSRNFSVPSGYYVSHERLDITSQKAKVLRVIDGDTLVVEFDGQEEKIRLIGVDTPETVHPEKQIERYGIQATNFTKSQLENKEIFIEVESDNLRDKYGRLLAYVFIDNKNFNEELLLQGYAKLYMKYDFKYQESFKKSEYIAKKEKKGIWQDREIIQELNKLADTEVGLISEETDALDQNIQPENRTGKGEYMTIYKNIIHIYNASIPEDFQVIQKSDFGFLNNFYEKNNILDNPGSREKYREFVEGNFYQSIRKNKTGLKISGKTIADSQVELLLKHKYQNAFVASIFPHKYIVFSDHNGEYNVSLQDLEPGNYQVYSKVVDTYKNKISIGDIKEFEISQEYYLSLFSYDFEKIHKTEIKKEKSTMQQINTQKDNLKIGEKLEAKITLQGRLGTKNIQENKIICYESCSINFDGRKSTGNIVKYIWDFGNAQIFEGANPKYVRYEKTGEYRMNLTVFDRLGNTSKAEYSIFYFGKQKKIKKVKSLKTVTNNDTKKTSIPDNHDNQQEKDDKYGIYFKIFILLLTLGLGFIILRREKII